MADEQNRRRWVFAGSCVDGKAFPLDGGKFRLRGLNVWDSVWQNVEEWAHVKDPIYQQDFVFGVYTITGKGRIVLFAAGEFSNLVWGFYLPADDA